MKNVPLKTLDQPEPKLLKISDLPIGNKFKFAFELDGLWSYQKISIFSFKCIDAPKCKSSSIGETLPIDESAHLDVVIFKG